ncbi:FlhB domain-containing protein [Dorea sp. 5-2]|nr:FlhB domain-containing protein [Dorea sp. 5-2]
MSQYDDVMNKKAVALRYDENKDVAPVIVASGLGYMAERIVEMANENGVPVYEDNSLATVLTQLDLGTAIPEELYQAIVDIYAYFLKYNPQKIKEAEEAEAAKRAAEEAAREAENAEAEDEAAGDGTAVGIGAGTEGGAAAGKAAKEASGRTAKAASGRTAKAVPGRAAKAARPTVAAAKAKPAGKAAAAGKQKQK